MTRKPSKALKPANRKAAPARRGEAQFKGKGAAVPVFAVRAQAQS